MLFTTTNDCNPPILGRRRLFKIFALIGTFFFFVWTQDRATLVSVEAASDDSLYYQQGSLHDEDGTGAHQADIWDNTNEQHRKLQSFDTRELEKNFKLAKAKFSTKLKEDYGNETYNKLFFDTTENGEQVSITRSLFHATELSWDRMKRKVAMKILTAQIETKPQPFIWSTGGHSASAGHGNLFNESYTFVLGVGGSPIFEAVGLDFTARSGAMGGTPCGMEIAICAKEVFGRDIDVLSWDYGMTTGGDHGATELYFHRAAILPHRPYFVAINIGRAGQVLPTIEALGPAMFHMDGQITNRIEDSEGKTQEELDQMPPYIRCFRLGKKVETDTCGKFKYTSIPGDKCDQRKGKASWHPGWKWHALYGNLLTLFWVEIIEDALTEIAQNGSDPSALLKTFKQTQDQEYSQFTSKNASNILFAQSDLRSITDVPNELVYWEPNLCHTARLPAEIRYLGILTESDLKGGHEKYDPGNRIKDVQGTINERMPLTYDPGAHEEFCTNYTIRIDHQDFFLVNNQDWSSLVLPNGAEKSYYDKEFKSLQGFISICLASCGWKCPPGVLNPNQLGNSTLFSMKVNEETVESFSPFGAGNTKKCMFLKHTKGHKWRQNTNGQYEISAKTIKPSTFVRVSSLVFW